MKEETLLQLRDVQVHYGGVKALDGVSIAIDEGEMVALMGPNGAGKSTVLKAIFGLAPISSGQVLFHEQPIVPVPYKLVLYGVALVPQGRRVFTNLTVEENLEIGGFSVGDKAELKRRMEEVMDTFPILKRKRKTRSGMLSGGEQQMLALARGLVTNPKVLLLDEPSLGLAPKVVVEVFERIKEINERHKTAIIIVEHNIKSLLKLVDRAYVMDKGKVIKEGSPDSLTGSGILEKVFLGELE